jgi:hypothetical protein
MKTSSLLQLLEKHKVVIPIIQRDYAQGRQIGKVPKIRERFLSEMVKNLEDKDAAPLELDFIYGYTNEQVNNIGEKISFFTPLDGQQRLTTLYLLHWFAASKEKCLKENQNLLAKFTYATRHSSRLFCEELVNFQPEQWETDISKLVIEQPWFFSAWKNDPTVSSMLVMLDAIQKKFKDYTNLWSLLSGDNPRIVFHLLPMEKLGLPDDLYIKMNSRGKELTDFEHFKSRFSEILKPKYAKIFNDNIDTEWSDLFWSLFKKSEVKDIAKLVDSGFLSFFWYVSDILAVKNGINPKNKQDNGFLEELYGEKDENIEFLFSCLNLFKRVEKNDENYFKSLFYLENYEENKCKLFFQNPEINLFKKCCKTYGYEGKANTFSIGEQLMLYASILNQLNNTEDFNNRIRKIRNVLISSEFQLRKESLFSLYEDIEAMTQGNDISTDSKLSKSQIEEENVKATFLQEHPNYTEIIQKLEDNHLLRGTISIFDIDENITVYANCFRKVFKPGCNYFEISQAMLTIGDYSQGYSRLKRFGNGTNSTWRELLTPNEYRKNFKETKRILREYLNLLIHDENVDDKQIISEYNTSFDDDLSKPKDWMYYYVRYDNFKKWNNQHQTNGFYSWSDIKTKPYVCNMMFRTQFNGRHWNPYLLELSYINKHCTIENYGSDLQFTCGEIILLISGSNNGFRFYAAKDDVLSANFLSELITDKKLNKEAKLEIAQNEVGIDTLDRIQVCNTFLNSLVDSINKK